MRELSSLRETAVQEADLKAVRRRSGERAAAERAAAEPRRRPSDARADVPAPARGGPRSPPRPHAGARASRRGTGGARARGHETKAGDYRTASAAGRGRRWRSARRR